MIKIRTQNPDDPQWIIDQHAQIYPQEFGFDETFAQGIEQKMAAILARTESFNCIWIAEVDGQRAGSLAIWQMEAGVAFLNFVLVLPAYRGRGIAHSLLSKAITHTQEQGFERIRLETYDCLQTARGLYRQLGFKVVEANREVKRFGVVVDQEFWESPVAGR